MCYHYYKLLSPFDDAHGMTVRLVDCGFMLAIRWDTRCGLSSELHFAVGMGYLIPNEKHSLVICPIWVPCANCTANSSVTRWHVYIFCIFTITVKS